MDGSLDIIAEETISGFTSMLSYRHAPALSPARTAMGEYIVPPGGKPLTRQGGGGPGPAVYRPKVDLTKSKAPSYSMGTRLKYQEAGESMPSPFVYDTSSSTEWKNKKFSMTGRRKDWLDKHVEGVNTASVSYTGDHLAIGKGGPKFSVGRTGRSNSYAGLSSSLVQPVDIKGFRTPGPVYRPKSGHWGRGRKSSFGYKRAEIKDSTPGPGSYDTKEPQGHGPSHSFGIKLPDLKFKKALEKVVPAANEYNVQSTIGKGKAVSISGRLLTQKVPDETPSPATYNTAKNIAATDKGKTLTYRWFDTDATGPGPADHYVKDAHMSNLPSFSLGPRVKATYPISLTSGQVPNEAPGPGAYDVTKTAIENDGPSYTFRKGKENSIGKTKFPGPNYYQPEKRERLVTKHSPEYTIAKQLAILDGKASNPGPAEYFPKLSASERGQFTMTSRPKDSKESFINPAPNKYTIPEVMLADNKGMSLKSRASPYVYSGRKSNKLEEPRTISLPRISV